MRYLNLLKTEGANFYEMLFNITKKSMGNSLDQSRVVLRGKELEQLGDSWTGLTQGLKNPSVAIGTNARVGSNSSITGVVIGDSTNGAVRKYALAVENSGKDSIIQFREQALNSRGEMQTVSSKLWNTSDSIAKTDPMLDMFIGNSKNVGAGAKNTTVSKQTKHKSTAGSTQDLPVIQMRYKFKPIEELSTSQIEEELQMLNLQFDKGVESYFSKALPDYHLVNGKLPLNAKFNPASGTAVKSNTTLNKQKEKLQILEARIRELSRAHKNRQTGSKINEGADVKLPNKIQSVNKKAEPSVKEAVSKSEKEVVTPQAATTAAPLKPLLHFEPIENLSYTQIENEISTLSKQLEAKENALYQKLIGRPAIKGQGSDGLTAKYHPDTGARIELDSVTRQERQECLEMRTRLYNLSLAKTKHPEFKPDEKALKLFVEQNKNLLPEDLSGRIAKIAQLPEKERIDAAVKMFAKDIKIPAEHIKIEPLPYNPNSNHRAAFSSDLGIIQTNFPPNISATEQIAMLRHEMDHMELFAKICKAMGYKDFTRMIQQKNKFVTEESIRKSYENLIKNVDIKGFNVEKYKKAFSEYNSMYQFSDRAYAANPIENRAYKIQAQYDRGTKALSSFVASEISFRYHNLIDEISKLSGKSFNEFDFAFMMNSSLVAHMKDCGNNFITQEMYKSSMPMLETMITNLKKGIPVEETAKIYQGWLYNII